MSERKPSEPALEGQKKDDEIDLTTVLDQSQRADLTLLVANTTESMRKLILENFDAMAGLDKKLLRVGMTDDEKFMAADPATADVAAYDKERKLKAEIEKDLATLKMKNLKKNSLKAFDEWREQVILRVGQVVNSEKNAQEQVKKDAKADKAKPQAPNTTGRVMEAGNRTVNVKFKDLFPPTKTALTKMAMNQRTLVLHSILLLLLSLEHYNAFSRILLLNLTSSLKLPLKTFEQDEYATAKGLLEVAKEMTADDEIKKKIKENEETRKRRVRYAAVAGAAILGVAGGMATPLVAAGVGSVMGGLGLGATTAATYLGSVAGSTVVVGSLFGAYGGRMTGQMMDSYAREVEDFQFLPVHGSSDKKTSEEEEKGAQEASEHDHKLRVTIGISGWLTEKEEVVKPWRSLGNAAEVFALKYELEALLNLGNAMNGMVQSAAWGYAQKEAIGATIFADLAAAMWPIALMKVARVIDNPFSVAKSRADKAGEVLADALINRAQGERPVTLIGYSLGARVIYTCLMSLAKRKQFGLVENAVLIGAPTPSDTSDWRILRSAVAGRLVNVYSVNDYVLGFMYRTSAIQYGVAGLQKVEGLASVENFDVSEDVSSHQRYRYLIGAILKKIGFEDIDMAAVDREREELVKIEKEEEKQSLAAQKKWLLRRESKGGKVDEAAEGEAEADELEKKVQEQTKKSLVTRAIQYFYLPSVPSAKDAQKLAGNLQKAGQNPTQAGNVAGQTVKDVQASTESYATYLYKRLPSMPYGNQTTPASTVQKSAPLDPTKTTEKTVKKASKATEGVTSQAQSYVQQASQYLPSLPNMSSLTSSSKEKKTKAKPKPKAPQANTASGKASETATDTASTATTAAKTTAGAVSELLTPLMKNALSPKDNPAIKSTKEAADKAPIIKQAKDRTPAPVKEGVGAVSDAAGTTVQNAGQMVQKGADTATGKASEAGKTATEGAQTAAQAVSSNAQQAGKPATDGASTVAQTVSSNAQKAGKTASDGTQKTAPTASSTAQQTAKTATDGASTAAQTVSSSAQQASKTVTAGAQTATKQGQSYTSRAASYLPTMPSLGFGGGGTPKKRSPPKLPKKASETPKVEAPAAKEKEQPPAALEGTSSGMKSPPPKLAPKLNRTPSGPAPLPTKGDRSPSGVKTPIPKTDNIPSSLESPPPKLNRTPSGIKSPTPLPTKLDRTPSASSGIQSTPTNTDNIPSGLKSPPPKLSRNPSGVKSPPTSVPTPNLIQRLSSSTTGWGGGAIPSGIKSPPTSVPTPNLTKRVSFSTDGGGGGRTPTGIKSPPKLGPRRTSSQMAGNPAPPTPASIEERLASIPSAGVEAEKKDGEVANKAAGLESEAVQEVVGTAAQGGGKNGAEPTKGEAAHAETVPTKGEEIATKGAGIGSEAVPKADETAVQGGQSGAEVVEEGLAQAGPATEKGREIARTDGAGTANETVQKVGETAVQGGKAGSEAVQKGISATAETAEKVEERGKNAAGGMVKQGGKGWEVIKGGATQAGTSTVAKKGGEIGKSAAGGVKKQGGGFLGGLGKRVGWSRDFRQGWDWREGGGEKIEGSEGGL